MKLENGWTKLANFGSEMFVGDLQDNVCQES